MEMLAFLGMGDPPGVDLALCLHPELRQHRQSVKLQPPAPRSTIQSIHGNRRQLRARQLLIVEDVVLPPQSPAPPPYLVSSHLTPALSPPLPSTASTPLLPLGYFRARHRSDGAGSGYAIAPPILQHRRVGISGFGEKSNTKELLVLTHQRTEPSDWPHIVA